MLNSIQPSQSCFCLWRHDLQTESTVVHAVELSSVEFSWVELCRCKRPFKPDIEAVESVQRRFKRRLPGFKKFSYAERLKRLDLPSLELGRLHCNLLWCYKIVFGHADINFDDMFELRMSTNTRGHKYKLFKTHNTSSLRPSFYTERVVNAWNHLPSDVVNFSTLSAFERTIKLVDFTDYLICF